MKNKAKIIRCLIIAFMFLCLANFPGHSPRQSQEMAFALFTIVIFSMLLDNIWLTLFMWLSVFLLTYYRFKIGNMYVSNLFFGCVIYYTVKRVFHKHHVSFLINGLLWLCALNIFYMVLQLNMWDLIYRLSVPGGSIENSDPSGLMGYKGALGVLYALCVPLLASRKTLLAKIASLGLFVPLYLCQSSICVAGAVISLIFVVWCSLPKYIIVRFRKDENRYA